MRELGERTLSPEDSAALYELENFILDIDWPGDVDHLMNHIFKVIHWINAPDCRKNHPNWSPYP